MGCQGLWYCLVMGALLPWGPPAKASLRESWLTGVRWEKQLFRQRQEPVLSCNPHSPPAIGKCLCSLACPGDHSSQHRGQVGLGQAVRGDGRRYQEVLVQAGAETN